MFSVDYGRAQGLPDYRPEVTSPMISIRRFLDRHPTDPPVGGELPEAVSQLQSLLQSGIAIRAHVALAESRDFDSTSRELLRRLEEPPAPLELARIATAGLEASEKYTLVATEHLREQSGQMQSMVLMLTETVAHISGQSEGSVARLQTIERQIERASGLNDIRALKTSLAGCLAAVKEAAVQQKKETLATVERLSDRLKNVPPAIQLRVTPPAEGGSPAPGQDPPEEPAEEETKQEKDTRYVAAFTLQQAGYVLKQYGEGVRDQMLARIGQGLEAVQGPGDELMRWKGTSFVMFLVSSEDITAVRRRLSIAVTKLAQCYVETGKNSAPLAVGVDWVVFPEARHPSPDHVFAAVDAFLAGEI
jgi:GGDEF domain-containing protein